MAFFRKPKTQNERRSDHALGADDDAKTVRIKARRRDVRKAKDALPSDRDDVFVAARNDRSRGKATHSPVRKAKQKLKS